MTRISHLEVPVADFFLDVVIFSSFLFLVATTLGGGEEAFVADESDDEE